MGILEKLLGIDRDEREGWHKSPHPHKVTIMYKNALGELLCWEKEFTQDYMYILIHDENWRYAYGRAKEYAYRVITKGFRHEDEDNWFPAHMVEEVRVREISGRV